MTTIASDGKVVAADGQAICGETIVEQDCTKIVLRNGRVFAIAGWHGAFEPVLQWIIDGADADQLPKIGEFVVIEFLPDAAHVYRHDLPYPDPYKYPCAFGSGQPYALAAMAAGRSPEEAVFIACGLDPGTGGKIHKQTIAVRELLDGKAA